MNDKEWSVAVAGLAADALVDSGLIKAGDLEKASEVIAEEILVRLSLNDRPEAK
jgi:hypothetical protein